MIELDGLRSFMSCRVDTDDVEAARFAIGEIFCPHFLTTEKSSSRFHARHHIAAADGYSGNLVSYGSAVEIDPGELSRFFLLQIPINGTAEVRCGAHQVHAKAGTTASLLSPTLSTRMRWSDDCEKMILLLERAPVERLFEIMTHEPSGSIEFHPSIDLRTTAGQNLRQHATLMVSAILPGQSLSPQYTVLLRDGLASLLLSEFAHNRLDSLRHPQSDSGPVAVRKADDFMRAHASQSITTGEIALAAGVPLRTLQDSYRKARGVTLTEALQAIRLDTLRSALLQGGPGLSVADAVFSAGLGHLGRAAAAYRARYGESPQQTLRRSKS